MTPAGRLLNRIEVAESGCWRWNGYIDPDGYGRLTIRSAGGRALRAHRLAYEVFVGPIPTGKEIDHRCHNGDEQCAGRSGCVHRRCINPAHLEAVTRRENLVRSHLTLGAVKAALTHCPRGHPYSGPNLYIDSDGRRRCRTCLASQRRARRGRR